MTAAIMSGMTATIMCGMTATIMCGICSRQLSILLYSCANFKDVKMLLKFELFHTSHFSLLINLEIYVFAQRYILQYEGNMVVYKDRCVYGYKKYVSIMGRKKIL